MTTQYVIDQRRWILKAKIVAGLSFFVGVVFVLAVGTLGAALIFFSGMLAGAFMALAIVGHKLLEEDMQ